MRCWEPVPRGPVLWAAQAEPWATWVPLLCFVLHAVAWLLIFSILLVFDYAELMGLKQVRPVPYLPSFLERLSLARTSRSSPHARPPSSCMAVSLSPASEARSLLGLWKVPGPEVGSGAQDLEGAVPGPGSSRRWLAGRSAVEAPAR